MFGILFNMTVLFLINYLVALVSIILTYSIYLYISRKAPNKNWGSQFDILKKMNAINTVIGYNRIPTHIKNWTPDILCLGNLK
jgi:hypothetical protein